MPGNWRKYKVKIWERFARLSNFLFYYFFAIKELIFKVLLLYSIFTQVFNMLHWYHWSNSQHWEELAVTLAIKPNWELPHDRDQKKSHTGAFYSSGVFAKPPIQSTAAAIYLGMKSKNQSVKKTSQAHQPVYVVKHVHHTSPGFYSHGHRYRSSGRKLAPFSFYSGKITYQDSSQKTVRHFHF